MKNQITSEILKKIKKLEKIRKSAFNKKQKKLNTFDRLVPDQFKFHYDTVLIRKNPYALQPDDLIHLSSKWHGTSGISAYVLCKHPLSWKD